VIRSHAGARHEDPLSSLPPAAGADLNCACTRLAVLREDGQFVDAGDHGEERYVADRAERRRRAQPELGRGHTGLDPLAYRDSADCWAELDGGTMNNAKHPPVSLRPTCRLVDADPVHGGDDVVVDRPEGRDQAWDAINAPGVLVAPRTCGVETKHRTGDIVRQIKRPRAEIIFGRSPARITRFVPDGLCPFNPDDIVFGASPTLCVVIDCAKVPLVDMTRLDGPLMVMIVSWLPCRETKLCADVVAASAPVIASMAVAKQFAQELKPVSRARGPASSHLRSASITPTSSCRT
jgi:hypothetical protein